MGFESRVDRFKIVKPSDVGPGCYRIKNAFEEGALYRRANPIYSKSDRFIDNSELKKFPGPGHYKVNDDWYKVGFSLMNTQY